MASRPTVLVTPAMTWYDSWATAVAEFRGERPDGSGIPVDAVTDTSREACVRQVERARRDADTTVAPLPGRVHADAYWIVDKTRYDDPVVGFIQLRHQLTDFLREVGGHIGYSVRPSRRREGHASRALALALDRACGLGLTRVMLSCDEDNPASYRTIEGNGGVLQDVVPSHPAMPGPYRRYWIDLGGRAAGVTHAR